jgi:phosphoglycerol geranylgeranyltransferase
MMREPTVLSMFGSGRKRVAVQVDPDKYSQTGIKKTAVLCREAGIDLFFYGSSLLVTDHFGPYLEILKNECDIPIVLFPGNDLQINDMADAILLLSLISGRNAEMLIGRHVVVAPFLKQSRLEIIPTGYMLIDSGFPTAVSYMSQTSPIPREKTDIAVSTAMAGEMLGLKLIYMDAGSGGPHPVLPSMIRAVRESISVPLVIGGGIRRVAEAKRAFRAGADAIVIGNAVEKDPGLIRELADSRS